MNRERKIALAEVAAVLNRYANQDVIRKIPKEVQKYIFQNKAKDYEVHLKSDCTILEQNLLQETRAILSVLYRDYIRKVDKIT